MKFYIIFFISVVLFPLLAWGSPDVLNITNSELGEKDNNGKKVEGEFNAGTGLATGGDIVLLPSIQASFEDVWVRWIEDTTTKEKIFTWKYRFTSSISLNGEIDPDSNEDLVQKFMMNGGNLNIDLKYGVTAKGRTNDGLSVYVFGKYAYLDTKEFTTDTETQELILETSILGLGLGVKFLDKFYMGWEAGRSSILGSEDASGAFFQAVDAEIIRRVVGIWKLENTSKQDSKTYINFYRAWGANGADAQIGIGFSKFFKLDF